MRTPSSPRLLSHVVAPLGAALLVLLAAPAQAELIYATNGTAITRFDSLSLNALTTVTVSNLGSGETLVGIDTRPADQLLYGVGSTSRIYQINPITGFATPIGSSGAFTLSGTAFGTDFNPVPDRLRQISNTEQNLRLNANDGTLTNSDSSLNPAGNFVAVAYSNNFAGATSTTLYAIDSVTGVLSVITVPNSGGPISTVGSLSLGTNLNEAIGFDISGASGTAYATVTVAGVSNLYTINLTTGTASLAGAIGTGNTSYVSMTVAGVPEPATLGLLALGALGCLARRRRPSL